MSEHVRASDFARDLIASNDAQAGPSNGMPAPPIARFQPFPVDALPPSIARFVTAVAGATGTDPSWAALAALTVIAGCVGNRAAVRLKHGWVEPAILWAALIGKSGSIKSVVLRLVTRPLVELFKAERDAFAAKLREHATAVERHSVAMSKWRAEQKSGPPTDPPLEPEVPRERRVLVSDITVEKLASLLGENPLGLLVVRDELAGLVNSFNRYAGGKGSDLQNWLSMNDGGPLVVDRKTAGSAFVERGSVSLLGTIQPFTLEHVFGSLEREAGLLARILLAYPPDQPALWSDAELPDEVVAEWRELLATLLAFEPARDDAGQPRPRLIGLADDAPAAFIQWHDNHAHGMAAVADDHLRAHWSKLKGTCARIALLFACLKAVEGATVSAVSPDCVRRAIVVTEWLKGESARVYGGLAATREDRNRQRLLEWIARHGGRVSVRDLTHGCWAFRGDATAARVALGELAELGFGRWVYRRSGATGGKPSEQLELVPSCDRTITNTPAGDASNEGIGDGEVGDGGPGSLGRGPDTGDSDGPES